MKENKPENAKSDDLHMNTEDSSGEVMSNNQGLRVNDDQNSLTAGDRGPTLLEDFHFREKMTHFDHERIPERVVHARGEAAHGYFESYGDFSSITKAGFLGEKGKKTPVFTRFSTVAGFKGSSDLARDVRGFAVKFYTEEGNYDLVGNNMPVFFIQDAMKFPDLIHAVKPEQDNEIPQAASAHDTFWDFISLMPESMHMIMWVMSDRALPRSLSMMEGFGVHTYRFINKEGKSVFVKFHWKPKLGTHSVIWEEAQKISGQDPDFHRRDLWESIENGNFPEWELGVQLVEEKDEHKFDFDLLDPTKLIPEELVPVKILGKMVLNRNPDNFFAETEQVAFHPGHVVPGIDFTNDPLLQGRLFSYTDTQLTRLGGPNFAEIPINRPITPVHNNQRGGFMRQTINKGKGGYNPNKASGGCPFQASMAEGGYVSHHEKIEGHKIRNRSKSFMDHFSQATLFYSSQTEVEQHHIIQALQFELGKVKSEAIRNRMVGMLTHVDQTLAEEVAKGLGIKEIQKPEAPLNHSYPADADPSDYQPTEAKTKLKKSEKLSLMASPGKGIQGRMIAILADDGVDEKSIKGFQAAIKNAGADSKIISTNSGSITASEDGSFTVDHSLMTTTSVLFDAVLVLDGSKSTQSLKNNSLAIRFIDEAYRHYKYIGINGTGESLWDLTYASKNKLPKGVLFNQDPESFIDSISSHRVWERKDADQIPV
ncbi:catalase [Algoriphagus halophytocola]|uniref:Catalase n=1 Tax=Algoriphagus halophytocola TaxID=2991499 RepID=A0ABY6MKW0_9BACT|nr:MULTISPECIES: catalase [unclassified Algoriphagus]UZD22916.1 catalase [Algoriphagus sp. TR-M5]WBL44184.1 catalase [Algoriphagus sp. TR-M9]